jgi:pimeloyl-ACP methyl ester carboxylesterase
MPDQRAHGRSTGTDPDLATLVDDARRMLDALSPDAPAHLVGVSMGGMVAAQVATRWPERVATLTLISAPPAPDPKWMAYFRDTPPEGLPEATQRLARHWHGEPRWRELARALFARFSAAPPDAFAGRPRVARALVMQATGDELLSADDPELWRARIDGAATIERPPGDHAFFADGRDGTRAANRSLRRFLDE